MTFNLCHPDCGQEPEVSAVGSCQYWRRKHFFHSHNVLLKQTRPAHTFKVRLDVPNNTSDPEVLFILFMLLKSKCSHANRESAVVSGPVELRCRLSLSISLTTRSLIFSLQASAVMPELCSYIRHWDTTAFTAAQSQQQFFIFLLSNSVYTTALYTTKETTKSFYYSL